ncbi:unnamed protein product [Prunus armeniaca]|uniref:F-box domain-containing protein n=1 Tax=Prunus armeniaca TaxID=36596 RepID=A0A6J5XX35_PRUAR|nr:unnamed protein product [Prunus armeniaca]CAB4318450.1 unnamed protein product [Prunus armeniaca]
MKGILGSFCFERKYFDTTIDLLSNLIPHRLIILAKGLEEPNAKRNDKSTLIDLSNEKSTLIDLPNEIIFDILMRLLTKSLSEIRGLSKTSSNIVDDPFFTTLHTQRLLNSATAPVEAARLMFLVQIWSCKKREEERGSKNRKVEERKAHQGNLLYVT